MIPARGCIIVKPVSTEEKRAGSPIILLEDTRAGLASHQMLVVSVGEPEICEDEDCDQPKGPLILNVADFGAREDSIDNTQAFQSAINALPDNPATHVHPTDKRIKPDAWILVRPRSLVELSSADKLYSVRISDVYGVFEESADVAI